MYCRNCGNELSDNAVNCPKCNTPKGQGVNYCLNCGFHTNIRREYCLNCGAKLEKIIPQKVKDEKIKKIKKQVKSRKHSMLVLKSISLCFLLLSLFLFITIQIRPKPANLPETPSYLVNWGTGSYVELSPGYEVEKYWMENRTIAEYALLFLFVSIICFVIYRNQNKRNKNDMNIIRGKQNVL